MRQIILDTETTGLDPGQGHRVIEIAGVEIENRRLTGNHFHRYVNPERASDEAALQIHGLTAEFLSDKPKFREIAEDFLGFVSGAELIIHNAAFDVAFLDYELKLLDRHPIAHCCASVVDSLKLAKEMYPGKRNGLDALCDRYEINRSARTLHGALLDARLLAEVYLAMTRGQESLVIEVEPIAMRVTAAYAGAGERTLVVLRASEDEAAFHQEYLEGLEAANRAPSVWASSRVQGAVIPA